MAAILSGQPVTEVAKNHDVAHSVVSRWQKEIPHDQLDEVGRKKGIDFGCLLGAYLQESLVTLKEQAIHFRDKPWLKQQTASDLGVLHGILADKSVRLLEAAEAASRAAIEAAGLPRISESNTPDGLER